MIDLDKIKMRWAGITTAPELMSSHDEAVLAAAPADIKALVQEVERLRGEVEKWKRSQKGWFEEYRRLVEAQS